MPTVMMQEIPMEHGLLLAAVLFALGLILGLLRLRTNSFWPGVGVHAANNLLAFVALLLALR